MKKVTDGEKAFIIALTSLLSGLSASISHMSIASAFLNGIAYGLLAVFIICVLRVLRS